VSLVLASSSPRRLELLATLGLEPLVRPAHVDESLHAGEDPLAYVQRLALDKARAVPGETVVAADTTVEIDGTILGKPADRDDAAAMLAVLSGRTHRVHTGVAVRHRDRQAVDVVTTSVTFVDVTPAIIEWYLATGEPMDKAGAYAIQGAGAALVERIEGSVTNVIGLPLTTVLDLARRLGVELLGRPVGGDPPDPV
jgi:septum formation protein